jgi:hypothetical protein
LTAQIAAGDYTLTDFARSTVTGQFDNVVQVPIKVR